MTLFLGLLCGFGTLVYLLPLLDHDLRVRMPRYKRYGFVMMTAAGLLLCIASLTNQLTNNALIAPVAVLISAYYLLVYGVECRLAFRQGRRLAAGFEALTAVSVLLVYLCVFLLPGSMAYLFALAALAVGFVGSMLTRK